ncbi:TetR/AcrR family transcriptional regulator [Thermaurantiacus sp.]
MGRSNRRPDGRRLRSETSRSRIVAALMALVGEGELAPTAERVANRAGLSLRTVFRHFEEMDTLYFEITRAIIRQAQPLIGRPFVATTWPDILTEIVDRRAEYFESVTPFKRALDLYRTRSPALEAASAELAQLSRQLFLSRIPPERMPGPPAREAMVLLVSIDSWICLRHVQGLDIAAAKAAILAGLRALLA